MPKTSINKPRKLSEDESFAQGLENITSSKSARPKRIYISKFQIGTLLLMSIPMAYGIQGYSFLKIPLFIVSLGSITAVMSSLIYDSLHTRLIKAINAYDFEQAEKLIDKRPDLAINKSQQFAIDIDDPRYWRMTKFILSRGADINFRDCDGRTALMHLAGQDYSESNKKVINAMLKQKAGINLQDKDGKTALIYAVQANNLEMVKFFLKQKAGINLQDKDGKTALIYAAQANNLEMVELFLAKKNTVNDEKITEILALSELNSDIRQILKKYRSITEGVSQEQIQQKEEEQQKEKGPQKPLRIDIEASDRIITKDTSKVKSNQKTKAVQQKIDLRNQQKKEISTKEAEAKKVEDAKARKAAKEAAKKEKAAAEILAKKTAEQRRLFQIDDPKPLLETIGQIRNFIQPFAHEPKITDIIFKGSYLYRHYLPARNIEPRDIDLEIIYQELNDEYQNEAILAKKLGDLLGVAINHKDPKSFMIWRGPSKQGEIQSVKVIIEDKTPPIEIVIRNPRYLNLPQKDWVATFDALRVSFKKDGKIIDQPEPYICSDLAEIVTFSALVADLKNGDLKCNVRNYNSKRIAAQEERGCFAPVVVPSAKPSPTSLSPLVLEAPLQILH